MKQIEALFVVPLNVPDFKGGSGRVPDAIEPPKMARFMLSYLDRRNIPVDLFDANLKNSSPQEVASQVLERDPRLVVMPVMGFNPSASTQTMVSAREFAEAIKAVSTETPIIMAGTHPAAIPEITLQTEPAVDYVCDGEGPITVHELIQALAAGGNLSDIRKVRSLWYREDGIILHNAPAPLLDLNFEPALAGWKFMDPRNYICHHWHAFYQNLDHRMPYANPFAREGCPHHCSFCNIQAPYRSGEEAETTLGFRKPGVNSFRSLSPENFVAEIKFLAETYGVRNLKIPDEMFGSDSYPAKVAMMMLEHLGSLCDELNIWCYFRVDSVRSKDLELLRSAGFRWLALGIEAANSTVRSGQDKGFNDSHIYKVVQMMNDAGMEGALNYIFGLPGDTEDTMQETFNLACDLNGLYGNFYCAQALPGSELYTEAKANGYPLPERPSGPGWMGHAQYSYESEPYFVGDSLTPAKILAFRDQKHREYYLRPEWRRMALAKPHCGEKAVASVDEWMRMISPENLKRRLLEKPKEVTVSQT